MKQGKKKIRRWDSNSVIKMFGALEQTMPPKQSLIGK